MFLLINTYAAADCSLWQLQERIHAKIYRERQQKPEEPFIRLCILAFFVTLLNDTKNFTKHSSSLIINYDNY